MTLREGIQSFISIAPEPSQPSAGNIVGIRRLLMNERRWSWILQAVLLAPLPAFTAGLQGNTWSAGLSDLCPDSRIKDN